MESAEKTLLDLGQVSQLVVDGVADGLAIGEVLGDDQGLACAGCQSSGSGLSGDNIVASLCSHFVVVGAGGDGGCGGSRVRSERGAVVGGHAAHGGEAGEAQVGLGDSAVVVHSALVEAGGLDLSGAHAAAKLW